MMQIGSRCRGAVARRLSTWLAIACLAACSLLAHRALAAQCLAAPARLPGLSGAPTWFDPGAPSPPWRAELNDPRWAGAPVYTLCSSLDLASCAPGLANAQFRVLLEGTTLYVSVQNLVDDTTTSDDKVFVGVAQPAPALGARAVSVALGGGSPIAVPPGIRSDATPPAPVPTNGVVTFSATTANVPGNWAVEKNALDPTLPGWLPAIGAQPGIALWKGSPGVSWAVTLQIDLLELGYAAPIVAPIRLFVGSRHVTGVGQVLLPNITTNTVGNAETNAPKDAATWTTFVPSGCSGIELDFSSIGVWTGASPLSSRITACPATAPWPPGCPGATNTFRVTPHNVPDSAARDATPHAIRANLRLANWGSTIDSWQHAPWQDMPGIGAPFEQTTLGNPPWQWIGSTSGSPTIQFTCPIESGHTYCPAIGNAGSGAGQSSHQCMLAEVRPQPGLNLPFVNAAAYRNMIFANLSSTSEKATVTIKGLQALTGKVSPRDLYLYVQTRNMPAHGDAPLELSPELMSALLGYAENPPPRPSARRTGGAGPIGLTRALQIEKFDPVSLADIVAGNVKDIRRLPPGSNPLLLPTLTGDQALGLAWPSYRVYVYYDTGERQAVGGTERALLAPMVPFGYYLKHAGTFFGFQHHLAGAGVQLEALGGDWYRVRVQNEGSVVVETFVSAEEKAKRDTPCTRNCGPHGEVKHRATCFCSVPGLGSSSGLGWLSLALLALLAARRQRQRQPRD